MLVNRQHSVTRSRTVNYPHSQAPNTVPFASSAPYTTLDTPPSDHQGSNNPTGHTDYHNSRNNQSSSTTQNSTTTLTPTPSQSRSRSRSIVDRAAAATLAVERGLVGRAGHLPPLEEQLEVVQAVVRLLLFLRPCLWLLSLSSFT